MIKYYFSLMLRLRSKIKKQALDYVIKFLSLSFLLLLTRLTCLQFFFKCSLYLAHAALQQE